jgi:hypothetical protein
MSSWPSDFAISYSLSHGMVRNDSCSSVELDQLLTEDDEVKFCFVSYALNYNDAFFLRFLFGMSIFLFCFRLRFFQRKISFEKYFSYFLVFGVMENNGQPKTFMIQLIFFYFFFNFRKMVSIF